MSASYSKVMSVVRGQDWIPYCSVCNWCCLARNRIERHKCRRCLGHLSPGNAHNQHLRGSSHDLAPLDVDGAVAAPDAWGVCVSQPNMACVKLGVGVRATLRLPASGGRGRNCGCTIVSGMPGANGHAIAAGGAGRGAPSRPCNFCDNWGNCGAGRSTAVPGGRFLRSAKSMSTAVRRIACISSRTGRSGQVPMAPVSESPGLWMLCPVRLQSRRVVADVSTCAGIQ